MPALLAVLVALLLAAPADARTGCGAQVRSAVWSGGTLTVVPTRCGRRTAASRPGRAFREAVRKAGGSAPNRRSLRRQLRCHAVFAPWKADWNLEAGRPHVSWPTMVATACNP